MSNEFCTCGHRKASHLGISGRCLDKTCPCRELTLRESEQVQSPSRLTDDELIEITGFSIADEGWVALHEMFQAPLKAGFTAEQALFIMCWAAFGPKFDLPTDGNSASGD